MLIMAFYQKQTSFDLGELNIENLFISDFMPSASGTYVKVYLLGLMFSRSENDAYRLDNKSLANLLSLPLQDVLEAWIYWESQGVIKRHFHEDPNHFDVEFLSLRALYIQNNYTSKSETKITKKDSVFRKRNEVYASLSKSVEQIVGHPLSYSEYKALGDFYDHYYPSAPIIEKAVSICYKDRNIRSMKAVKSLLDTWTRENLLTLEEIEKYNASQDQRFKVYKEVLKCLGLSFRMANEAEKQMIDLWIDQYGFEPIDIYDFLILFSKKNSNLNLNYLQKAFENMHTKGIKNVNDYNEARLTQKPETKKGKKNYTIEKEKHYTEDELEALLLKKN